MSNKEKAHDAPHSKDIIADSEKAGNVLWIGHASNVIYEDLSLQHSFWLA